MYARAGINTRRQLCRESLYSDAQAEASGKVDDVLAVKEFGCMARPG